MQYLQLSSAPVTTQSYRKYCKSWTVWLISCAVRRIASFCAPTAPFWDVKKNTTPLMDSTSIGKAFKNSKEFFWAHRAAVKGPFFKAVIVPPLRCHTNFMVYCWSWSITRPCMKDRMKTHIMSLKLFILLRQNIYEYNEILCFIIHKGDKRHVPPTVRMFSTWKCVSSLLVTLLLYDIDSIDL